MQPPQRGFAAAVLYGIAVAALLMAYSTMTVPVSSWIKFRHMSNQDVNSHISEHNDSVDIGKRQNVYFLKVHKTGSTTFGLILKRFVLKYKLRMPFFTGRHTYPSRDMIKWLVPIKSFLNSKQYESSCIKRPKNCSESMQRHCCAYGLQCVTNTTAHAK